MAKGSGNDTVEIAGKLDPTSVREEFLKVVPSHVYVSSIRIFGKSIEDMIRVDSKGNWYNNNDNLFGAEYHQNKPTHGVH